MDTQIPTRSPEREKMQGLLDQLDAHLKIHFENYQSLLKQFDKYSGIALEESAVKEVNELLVKIQYEFNVIYPALHWVGFRASFAKKVSDDFMSFMKDMQEAEVKKPTPEDYQ